MNTYIIMLCKLLPEVDIMLIKETFEERAAIREFDAGYPRDTAEHLAFADTLLLF
jgi:hypothetical protein